jgi:hypothetical protein
MIGHQAIRQDTHGIETQRFFNRFLERPSNHAPRRKSSFSLRHDSKRGKPYRPVQRVLFEA